MKEKVLARFSGERERGRKKTDRQTAIVINTYTDVDR